MRNLASAALVAFLAACGGFEGTVSQTLELKQGSITGSTLAQEKDFDASGTSWNEFLNAAKAELGGDPEEVVVTGAKLSFDAAKSKNVGKFEEAIKGEVVLFAKAKETNEIVELARIEAPTGAGTVELDSEDVELLGKGTKFAAGEFRLGLRGDAVQTTEDDFSLGVIVTLALEAR